MTGIPPYSVEGCSSDWKVRYISSWRVMGERRKRVIETIHIWARAGRYLGWELIQLPSSAGRPYQNFRGPYPVSEINDQMILRASADSWVDAQLIIGWSEWVPRIQRQDLLKRLELCQSCSTCCAIGSSRFDDRSVRPKWLQYPFSCQSSRQ